MGSKVSQQADVLLLSYGTNWLRLWLASAQPLAHTVTDSVAVNWIPILLSNMSAVLYSNRVSLPLTDIQHAVIHPFIKLLWKQWAVWSQACHRRQSRGTWEPKTDAVSSLLIWFLVCACRSYMGCTLIEIMQIRQGLIYLIIDFFSLLQCFFIPPPVS